MRLALLLAVTACSSPSVVEPAASPPALPRIVAHRGASHDAPENTLAAFRRAWELGVEAVELDVHVTRDGEVVVMHDATTGRTGRRDLRIADASLAELRTLDVGGGERIPTIAEAIATVPRGRTLFVELKSPIATVPTVARALRSAPRDITIALQAFDVASLVALARELPGAPAFWTADPPLDADRAPLPYPLTIVDDAKRHGVTGLALFHASVTEELLAEATGVGLQIDVWTINEAAVLAAALARPDLRWIETDRPDLVPRR